MKNLQQKETLRTGFKGLDEIFNLEKGQTVVITGETSKGKSAFTLQAAFNMAKNGKKILFFYLEGSKKSLLGRMMAQNLEIEHQKIRRAMLTKSEMQKMKEYTEQNNLDFFIVGGAGYTLAKITKTIEKINPDVLVIDYLSLLKYPEDKTFATPNELRLEVLEKLNNIAKERNILILAVMQYNEAVEKIKRKRLYNFIDVNFERLAVTTKEKVHNIPVIFKGDFVKFYEV